MKKSRKGIICAFGLLSVFTTQMVFADTVCTSSPTILSVPLKFYSHPIGTYTIFLSDTLTAIADGQADENGYEKPYYAKSWDGACPSGLNGDGCREYTVYPDKTNFAPGDIMKKIEEHNNGNPNRGEVRIITDNSESNYVYTTDHERTFCGPYPVPTEKN